MDNKGIIIIGGGLAGLATSHYLKEKGVHSLIVEKGDRLGGLCQSFSIGKEWFDIGGHVAFAKDYRVRELLEKGVSYHERLADALNYKNGKWIVHPVQNNLFSLDTEEKIRIIEDFIDRPDNDSPENYYEWLVSKYGYYFADNYPSIYTKKYWTVDPKMLETKWVGKRMYTPTIREMLFGAFEKRTKNVHYSNGVRYPITGGFEAFIRNLEDEANARCGDAVTQIDIKKKIIVTEKGETISYSSLVNTIPLPELVKIIDGVPDGVSNSAQKLFCTSLILISMYVKGEFRHNYPAFYIYDEDILPSRVFSTNQYSDLRDGHRAIQAEVYYSKFKPLQKSIDEIRDQTISQLIDMEVFDKEDLEEVDVKVFPYANIIFTPDIYENRARILSYLEENDIYCAGRFGLWDYLWSDQTIISAIELVEKIVPNQISGD